MSILHRIFVSKYKRKKIFPRRRPTYKKFIGLKTLKTILYTKFSFAHGLPAVVKKPIRRIAIKKPLRKPLAQARFPILKLLPPHMRREELTLARDDISNFKNLAAEKLDVKTTEKKFQAFLPQAVWDKMTSIQRSAHIKKRRALAVKGRTGTAIPISTYAFSNKKYRPMLRMMGFSARRQYLKNLIKFSRRDALNLEIAPFDSSAMKSLCIKKIKSVMGSNKKTRAKGSMYKNLTYTSIVPGQISKLNF